MDCRLMMNKLPNLSLSQVNERINRISFRYLFLELQGMDYLLKHLKRKPRIQKVGTGWWVVIQNNNSILYYMFSSSNGMPQFSQDFNDCNYSGEFRLTKEAAIELAKKLRKKQEKVLEIIASDEYIKFGKKIEKEQKKLIREYKDRYKL